MTPHLLAVDLSLSSTGLALNGQHFTETDLRCGSCGCRRFKGRVQ